MWVFLDNVYEFFSGNLPSPEAILIGGPLCLLWSFGCLWFAGNLKKRGMKTGYTRKIFHFLIFGTVVLLHWNCQVKSVFLFGTACSLVIFYAVWKGDGNMLYEAMAREKDYPRRTFFIMVPYFTTLLGGIAGNLFFGPLAISGYLVAGLGDAIGEPAGNLLGKHKYRVLSASSVPAIRTLEGSLAVFVMSAAAVLISALYLPSLREASFFGMKVLLIAFVSALTEAISPHGWDNFTMQVVPAAMISFMLA